MEKQNVHSFKKNENEEVRISVGAYKDKVYVDLRLFYEDTETREFRPTRKGLTLGSEFLTELRRGLERAEQALVANA